MHFLTAYIHYDRQNITLIQLIYQGTVDNNLGQDSFTGPKALIPSYCRQLSHCLHNLYLEVLTIHGTELRLFGAKAFPPTHTINVAYLT